jgi:hypothetical protein
MIRAFSATLGAALRELRLDLSNLSFERFGTSCTKHKEGAKPSALKSPPHQDA